MIYVTRIYKLNDIQHILYSEGTRKFSVNYPPPIEAGACRNTSSVD